VWLGVKNKKQLSHKQPTPTTATAAATHTRSFVLKVLNLTTQYNLRIFANKKEIGEDSRGFADKKGALP
jgi:hypothetical protein